MSYAVAATVSGITGIAIADINAALLTAADAHIESILGWDLDKGKDVEIQYFDIEQRNAYYNYFDGPLDFVLNRKPVRTIVSVRIDPYGEPGTLELNTEYTVNYENAIVTLEQTVPLVSGRKKLEVKYEYGFDTVPADIVNVANLLAAYYHDLHYRMATSSDGAILKEIEIGRYRELYDVKGEQVDVKYRQLFKGEYALLDMIKTKYGVS